MDRATAILGLTAIALTRDCDPDEALQIARDVLGDRDQVHEDDLPALVAETHSRALHTVWDGVI